MKYAKTFRANGKLLLTGEYVVLEGAKALSFPTKLGQELRVSFFPSPSFSLQWQSFDHMGNLWFADSFNASFQPTDATAEVSQRLCKLLQIAFENNPLPIGAYEVTAHLEFPREWGLGSSSSLIALLAQWSGCDPYILFYNTQNGSGYDVASALSNEPICFQRNGLEPIITPFKWAPPFLSQLAFVYHGNKQDSTQEVTRFIRNTTDKALPLIAINELTDALMVCDDIHLFEKMIVSHECILGELLEQESIQKSKFSDYEGVVKSLGAWGGDFMLITKTPHYEAYFNNKGFSKILDWHDLIL